MKTISKPIKFLLIAILAIASSISVSAQVEVQWSKTLPSDIIWQEVTSLGNLIVCSRTQLVGIDPETGDPRWTKDDLGGLNRATFKELPNSPFFTITRENSILLIDQLSGDVVFDSEKAGISDIEDYFLLYNSDAILVTGKKSGEPVMMSVKMSDGTVAWSMNEKFGRIVAVNELGGNELLIVTLFNNYKLESASGNIIWKEASSKGAEQADQMGALGAFMKVAAEAMVADTEIELRFYRPKDSDVFYLGSQQENQSSMSSSSGQPSISYSNVYNGFNVSDGKRIWDEELEVKGMLSQVAFLENGILVLPDDGNRTKINLFDYATHTGQWGKKGRGVAIKGGIYDYLDAGGGMLLVSQTASGNFLNYLDPSTGLITFEKPVKVNGRIVGIVPLSNGILYITTESMNILDQSTGVLKWKKSLKTAPSVTAESGGKIYAFDYKSKTIKVVDKESGTVSELSATEIEFQGRENPRKLEVMEDGVFLYSDQNVAKLGFDGKLIFQEYYPAPREPGWKRALLYAEAVRGAYVGAQAYYVSGSIAAAQDDIDAESEFAGELFSEIGDAYGELGDQASSYAINSFKQANARFKATASTKEYMLIMSKTDAGLELLKVNKSDGQTNGSIKLGKDKEPLYSVDDVTGKVFYCTEGNAITTYSLQ